MKITTLKKLLSTTLILTAILLFTTPAQSQFLKKLGKAAERAAARTVENRVERETQEKTDAALDSILEPGDKKGKFPQPEKDKSSTTENKGQDRAQTDDNEDNSSKSKSLEIYRKFDFVPGNKQLFFDDFSNDFIGDFPSKWNTDGGGEIVQLLGSDQKWFELKMSSFFIPDVPSLPEEYTIEFDILTEGLDRQTSSRAKLHVILDETTSFGYGKNAVYAYIPFCQYAPVGLRIWSQSDGKELADNTIAVDIRKTVLSPTHISIAVNKTRFRLWINESKYVDVPRLVPTEKIKSLKFEPVDFKDGKERLFITNLKVAEGGLDLRRTLLSEGKVSTNGILFDSGSSNIKPESMGIIRQIYQVMQQESTLKLKIVGHTDSDGEDSTNLSLSAARAKAVKNALISQYSIAADRLVAEGKGESEPISDNATADGKAQNRRVEFIKQ